MRELPHHKRRAMTMRLGALRRISASQRNEPRHSAEASDGSVRHSDGIAEAIDGSAQPTLPTFRVQANSASLNSASQSVTRHYKPLLIFATTLSLRGLSGSASQ